MEKLMKENMEDSVIKYPMQICQDEEITNKFRSLHLELVNKIISFCKENNIIVDEFHLNADSLEDSIKHGSWESCTDSAFSMIRFTDEYKDVVSMKKVVTDKEYKLIKLKQKDYLFSM